MVSQRYSPSRATHLSEEGTHVVGSTSISIALRLLLLLLGICSSCSAIHGATRSAREGALLRLLGIAIAVISSTLRSAVCRLL